MPSSPGKSPNAKASTPHTKVVKRHLKARLSSMVFVCPRKSCGATSDTAPVWGDYELDKGANGSFRATPIGNACGRCKKAYLNGYENGKVTFDSCIAECNASAEKDLEFESCARVSDGQAQPTWYRSGVGKNLKSGHRSLIKWQAVTLEGWKRRYPNDEPRDLGFKTRRLLHPTGGASWP